MNMKTVFKKATTALALVAVAGAFAAPAPALAQANYPDRPIRMIVPFPPGGATDIVARLLGSALEKRLGQPIIIDNKAGGGSNIGSAEAARAKPDGYTIFMGTIANTINMSVYNNLSYDTLRDFVPIVQTMTSPSVLVVTANFPGNNMQEVIAWAKANPGGLSLASSGAGGSPHMAAELLKLRTGIDYLHVPYKGAGPAMNDVLSGTVQGGFKTATAALGQIQAGKIKAIAVADGNRLPQLPNVPTMAEAGIADVNVSSWNGLFAPTGTPPAIIDRLSKETIAVLQDPAIRAEFEKRGATPVGSTPAEFKAFVEKEIKMWADVAKAAGVKIN